MSFDAGSVIGHLGLDISGYSKGMLEAEGISNLFPGVVEEFLADPLLGVLDIAKEVGEGIADAFQESIAEITELGFQISLAAEKAGTSVDFMSHWGEVAKSVNVDIGELGMGFKFLQQNAVSATEGNATAMKGFDQLGISVDFLKSHLNDTQGIFEAVRAGMQSLPDAAERSRVAMEILGRTGSDLVPIFNMSNEAVKEMMNTQDALGATMSDTDAQMARGMHEIGDIWDQFKTGLEKDIAIPVMDFILDHKQEIITGLEEIEQLFSTTFGKELQNLLNDKPAMDNLFKEIGHDIAIAANVAAEIFDGFQWLLDNGSKITDILDAFDVPLQFINWVGGGSNANAFGGGGPSTNNFQFNLNNANADEKTAQAVAKQTKQALQQAAGKRRRETAAQVHSSAVMGAIGGI